MTEREKFINSIFAEESSSLKEWIEQVKVDLDKLIEGEVKWRKERSIDQVKIVEYLVNQIMDLRDACHQKQEIIDGQKDYAKISLELERLKEEKEQTTRQMTERDKFIKKHIMFRHNYSPDAKSDLDKLIEGEVYRRIKEYEEIRYNEQEAELLKLREQLCLCNIDQFQAEAELQKLREEVKRSVEAAKQMGLVFKQINDYPEITKLLDK